MIITKTNKRVKNELKFNTLLHIADFFGVGYCCNTVGI